MLYIIEAKDTGAGSRDTNRSESIAVGNIGFRQNIKSLPGYQIKGRQIPTTGDMMHIGESRMEIDICYEWTALIGDNSQE